VQINLVTRVERKVVCLPLDSDASAAGRGAASAAASSAAAAPAAAVSVSAAAATPPEPHWAEPAPMEPSESNSQPAASAAATADALPAVDGSHPGLQSKGIPHVLVRHPSPEVLEAAHDTKEFECAICLGSFREEEEGSGQLMPLAKLPCRHMFHADCLARMVSNRSLSCPCCCAVHGQPRQGTQPANGSMSVSFQSGTVPGFPESLQVIVIDYSFPSGVQGPEHPTPGKRYSGDHRRAFLPDTPEGRKVLQLFKVRICGDG